MDPLSGVTSTSVRCLGNRHMEFVSNDKCLSPIKFYVSSGMKLNP